MLGEEVLAFDHVAPWTGDVQELRPRFQAGVYAEDYARDVGLSSLNLRDL
jgi:hypothetical protein